MIDCLFLQNLVIAVGLFYMLSFTLFTIVTAFLVGVFAFQAGVLVSVCIYQCMYGLCTVIFIFPVKLASDRMLWHWNEFMEIHRTRVDVVTCAHPASPQ